MYGEKGWRSIEDFIYQYSAKPEDRDDVNAIVEEINQQLKSSAVVKFLRQMGLLSVGYLLDSPWARTFQFFRGGEEDYQHYITPYIWKEQERSDRFSDLIHSLFLVVRDEQRDRLEALGHHSEEFYVRLPHIRSSGPSTDRAYYCPIGELLFWLYAWRLLWYFEHLAGPAEPFEAGRVALNHSLQDPATFTWCDESVDAAGLRGAVDGLELINWEAEYRVLCLYCAETRRRTPWVGTIEAYLHGSLGGAGVPGNDLVALDANLQRATADWLARIVPEKERPSCKAARLWMEAHVPAPLLPYYFWIGLDRWPKTYLVCPIWVSALYPTKVGLGEEVKETPIVGLALCGVSPLSAWDSTLTDDLIEGDFGVLTTAKHTLIEFLTLLGQPAVELHFAAELRRVERAHITAQHVYVLRRGLIHEGGQLGRLVTGFADGYLTKEEVSGMVRAVNSASEALARLLNVDLRDDKKRCGDIVAFVKDALQLPDLVVSWEAPEQLMDARLPAAMEYVLIELCRNAYNPCTRDSQGWKRVRVAVEEGDTPGHIRRISVTHPGVLRRPEIDTDTETVSPQSLDRGHGLDIIPYVVKEVMGGRFVLKQQEAGVHAYVERFYRNHKQ